MSGGCDFHEVPKADCVHCLGYQLALARAELATLRAQVGDKPKPSKPTRGRGPKRSYTVNDRLQPSGGD